MGFVLSRRVKKQYNINPLWAGETDYEITIEPRHDMTCLREFPTRPDTNRPAQPQKLASLEISAIKSRDIILSKQRTTKALIRLR